VRNTIVLIVTIHFHCVEKAAQNLILINSLEFHERKVINDSCSKFDIN